MFFSASPIGKAAAITALSFVSVLSLGGIAQAQTSAAPGGGSIKATHIRPAQPTAAQEACLGAKGFVKPDRQADSEARTPRTVPSAEQRTAFEDAAKACGVTLPSHGGPGAERGVGGPGGPGRHRPQVSSDQRTCLTSNGIAPPPLPAAGEARPARVEPTAEQRSAFEAAAKACGITLPAMGSNPHAPAEAA